MQTTVSLRLKRSVHALALVWLLAGCDRLAVSADPQTQVEQAYAALERKQYGEAIALFESALRQRPDATVFALLGDCYWSQWKYGNHDPRLLERANVEYRKGLALDGNHCGLNHALGRDLVLLNRPAEALGYLDAAKLRCARQSLEAQNLWFRIQALVSLRRLDEAQTEFAGMSERFALHPMTDLAGRLLADTTQDAALRAKYPEKKDAPKKIGAALGPTPHWHGFAPDRQVRMPSGGISPGAKRRPEQNSRSASASHPL